MEEVTEKKVFVLKILKELKDGVKVVAVFGDKTVIYGDINIELENGNLSVEFTGDYI